MSAHKSNIEAEVKDIKHFLIEISAKLDRLLYEKDIVAMMKLTEKTLVNLYKTEPDIYKVTDLKRFSMT